MMEARITSDKGVVYSGGSPAQTTAGPDRLSEVEAAYGYLDRQIARLDDLAQSLGSRLSSVVGMEATERGMTEPMPEYCAPLAARISGSAEALDRVAGRLEDLLYRVEV